MAPSTPGLVARGLGVRSSGLGVRSCGLGFGVRGLGRLLAKWPVIHARMAPPHTRVCGWRHTTRQATFLACVIELGETGSSLNPAAVIIPQATTQTIRAQVARRADRAGAGQDIRQSSRAGAGPSCDGEAECLTAQIGLYSTPFHTTHCLAQCGCKRLLGIFSV